MTKRLNLIAAGVFAVALGLLMWYGSDPLKVRGLQATFLNAITPFLRSGSAINGKVQALKQGISTLNQLEAEVQQLRVMNRELSATNQTLRGLETENNRLRNALGYRERANFQLMPARIIARDASTWYNTVTVDRGKADFIEVDQPVLTEEGLVGKTTSIVSEHSCVIVLISDESCKVAATVEGTREQGIVQGLRTSSSVEPAIAMNFPENRDQHPRGSSGDPNLAMNFLPKQAGLQSGQKVFTSGVGGVFPSGVFIGEIREFKARQLDGYATIVPAVNLTNLEDVFVVVSATK